MSFTGRGKMAEEQKQQGTSKDNNNDGPMMQGPIVVRFPRAHPQPPRLKLEVKDAWEGMEPCSMS